jgi:hypothetical protein
MRTKTVLAALLAAAILSVTAIVMMGLIPGTGGRFVKAVYGSAPLTEDRDANTTELFRLIDASGSDTYNFIVRNPSESMEHLMTILPIAKEHGIMVWVTIAPPSEISPEHRFDMQYVDYIGWARTLAQLSLQHENLEAWSIDNVMVDSDFFTPSYLDSITSAAKDINPDLKFIPVVYYPNVLSPQFDDMSRFFDGIQFYYTNFPAGESDESAVLLPQLETIRGRFQKPVILGIYASPWSRDYPTTPAYVEQLIKLARQHTSGVMIYTINQEGEKLAVIKKLFSE